MSVAQHLGAICKGAGFHILPIKSGMVDHSCIVKSRTLSAFLAMLVVAALVNGCSRGVQPANDAAIKAALRNPYCAEFQSLFPINGARATMLDRTNSQPLFVFEGIVHGRYLVTLVLPLTVEPVTLRVTGMGTPSFILEEFKSFERTSWGGSHSSYKGESNRRFGIEDWKKLVLSDGDLRVLGIDPITNSPLPNIEDYLRNRKRL